MLSLRDGLADISATASSCRPEEFVQIGGRDSSLAKLARDHGVDGILIHSDASRYTGTTTVVDSTYKEKKRGKEKERIELDVRDGDLRRPVPA